MSLRDDIARRLCHIHYETAVASESPTLKEQRRDAAYAVADEVIRLILWNRHDVEVEWAATEGFDHKNQPPSELTLPPEDWKP